MRGDVTRLAVIVAEARDVRRRGAGQPLRRGVPGRGRPAYSFCPGARAVYEGPASELIADPTPFASAGLLAPDVLRAQMLARECGCDVGSFTLDPVRAAAALCSRPRERMMGIPVPFGQFVPVDSPVHRLEPRVKLGLVVCYTVVLFSSAGWTGLGLATALVVLALLLSRVPLRLAMRGSATCRSLAR